MQLIINYNFMIAPSIAYIITYISQNAFANAIHVHLCKALLLIGEFQSMKK